MSISEIAIKRSTLVVVVFTALSLLGLLCYTKLNYELIPKMDMPMITVSTTYSGASADEVESSVTKKIEDALSSLSNMKYMSSTSQEGMSMISIELEANTNTDIKNGRNGANGRKETISINERPNQTANCKN